MLPLYLQRPSFCPSMAKSPPHHIISPGFLPKIHPKHQTILPFSLYSPRLFIFILSISVTLFTLFQIHSLHAPPPFSSSSSSRSLLHHYLLHPTNSSTTFPSPATSVREQNFWTEKLKQSVTFLPLKDLRYADKALVGHTWFMSSTYDTHEEEEVQHQQFPSQSSHGRLLCLKGRDSHDGSWNYYALAWPEALPVNATLMEGLTFVSYNHYDYDNIWHGLSAIVPFVAWHLRNNCESPTRWILYHWGEIRLKMAEWLSTLTEAVFGETPNVDGFEWVNNTEYEPVCFEQAVVMRHNEGGMSRERRMETYDLIRCRAREYCNVSRYDRRLEEIGLTLFMRTGSRSFRNESAVIGIFEKECAKVEGCRITVAYSNNLTVCEQVKLMSMTDILVSPHGAQLTNIFLMDRNSSVMEFFPKGWLKLAGVGQYVYQWISNWSGMRHRGAWRDPDGDECPFPEDDRRCMSIFKNGKIGFNETFFAEWARDVLREVKTRKLDEGGSNESGATSNPACGCRQHMRLF